MAKIVIQVHDCKLKTSKQCIGTFQRTPKRGRPPVACEACRNEKRPSLSSLVAQQLGKGQCPCGNVFDINPGRGRKPSKCPDCRTSGKIYRTDDEGKMAEVRAETLRREQAEKSEQAGRDRAENLFNMMKPLIARDANRRKVTA